MKTKLRKIKELAPKPSDAIQAMIDGLSNPRNLKIDMTTFGRYKSGICYGCAATACIQQLGNAPIDPDLIDWISGKAHFLNVHREELAAFENAIDSLRLGNIRYLMYFYGISTENIYVIEAHKSAELPMLNSFNYIEKLEFYKPLVEYLRSEGL